MKRIQITQVGQLRTKYGSFEIDDTNVVDAIRKAIGEDEDSVTAAVTITIDVLTEPLKIERLVTDTALVPSKE